MKTAALFLCAVVLTTPFACRAAPGTFLIASPDRPAVWFNRAGDKVNQNLEWNRSRHELAARVAYDRVEFIPLRDQTYYDTFRLRFPTVRLDEAKQRLYFIDHGRRIEFGSVKPGSFDEAVVLDRGVNFAVFRDRDTVHAAIASGISAHVTGESSP